MARSFFAALLLSWLLSGCSLVVDFDRRLLEDAGVDGSVDGGVDASDDGSAGGLGGTERAPGEEASVGSR